MDAGPPEPPAMPPPMPYTPAPAPPRTNGMAVASLVLGILALGLFFTIVFPVIFGILAVIFGIFGISKASQGADHKGLAIAGLVCGVLGIAAMILFVAVFATTTVEVINNITPSFSPMP
jgi:uncharacterized membrane protein HdeD (DUF308 family)